MKHRNRRKLFFPVGLIALCVFPIIGFQKLAEEYKKKTTPEHVMELNWGHEKPHASFPQLSIKYVINSRVYKPFVLTSDSTKNYQTLIEGRQLLNKIKKENDTINGVRFVFNDSTKYQDFITALDYCWEKHPHIFWPYKNDIWASYAFVDTSYYERERQERKKRGSGFKY